MAKPHTFSNSVLIAAPPEAVWPWLVDDERRARWQSGIASRISPDSVANITYGRIVPARHTVVESRPSQLFVEELESDYSRERDTYTLTPTAEGTVVELTAEAEAKKIEAVRPPIPTQTAVMNTLVGAGLLRLRNLVEASMGRPRHPSQSGESAIDSSLEPVLKASNKAIAGRAPDVVQLWNAMPESARARGLMSANSSNNAHDPYEARMAIHLADDMRAKFSGPRLALKVLLPLVFAGLAWFVSPLGDDDADAISIALSVLMLWITWMAIAVASAAPRQRRTAESAIALNASYLDRVTHVEQAIAYLDRCSPDQRVTAIRSLGAIPAEGSLNWLVESALSRYLRSPEPGVPESAAEAMRARRARYLDAAQRRLTPAELIGEDAEASLQRHAPRAIAA